MASLSWQAPSWIVEIRQDGNIGPLISQETFTGYAENVFNNTTGDWSGSYSLSVQFSYIDEAADISGPQLYNVETTLAGGTPTVVYLSEFSGTVINEQTEYMSNLGHITMPTDPLPNIEYEDVIKHIPLFTRSLGKDLSGQTRQSFGDIEVDNSDAERDGRVERSWNGRDITIKLGAPDWEYGDFRILLKGTIAELTIKNPVQSF